MHIPVQLHPFPSATLIIVTNNEQAKMYRAADREIELIRHISTKADKLEKDRNAVKRGDGSMGSAEQEDDRKEWSREHLYESLNKDLMRRWQNKEFETLVFTVPHEHLEELKESLHIDLLKRTQVFVPKNLMGEELIDLIGHVQEAA